jgi:SAM-dependent methyltransferase
MAYYHTPESVEEYIRLAKDVSGKELIEKLRLYLPEQSTVLELGSGPGTDYQILMQSYDVMGSDYSDAFLEHLKSTFPEGRFVQLDAANMALEERFAGIYANKVLHHLSTDALKDSIQLQHQLLLPNGIVCLSFWKGEGSEEFKGMFVNYHTEQGLSALFEDYFDILLLETYAEFEAGDSILMIAKRKN